MKRWSAAAWFLGIVLCRVGAGQATAAASLPDVAQSLKDYYADGNNVPPWKEAMGQLAASQAEVREKAGAYLRSLLVQSLKDEKSGVAPWRATPFWGSNGENPAEILRRDINEAMGTATLSDEAVSLLEWYINDEDNPRWSAAAAEALAKITGPKAGALLLELAARPHPNSQVVVTALKQIAARHLAIKPEAILALAAHYRSDIREQAVATAKALNIGPVPAYSDAAAMKSEAIKKLMSALADLMIEMPPADARFAAVTTTYFDGAQKRDEAVTYGWVLGDKDGNLKILTPFGVQKSFEISEKPEPMKYGGTYTVAYKVVPIEQEVERVAALRRKGDPDFQLSERGGLTGQFQGRGASLEEAMLAEWLYDSNRMDLAAKVLLPALDTLYEDQHLADMVKDRLGIVYAYHMLASFAGDRDYAQTLKWAQVVQTKFAGSRFDRMAAELARQLALRADDFTKLKLPTAAEWTDLQKGMDKPHQIAYLCERLRLVNCFQMGQPGGVDTSEKQYAEPCGISDDAAWGLNQGRTEVINPLGELGKEKLMVDDIVLLTPYLKEDWFMPSVEFWRDFNPQRELLRTRSEVAAMINHLAGDEICDDEKMLKMSAAEVDAYIEKINQFARDNKGRPEADLLLQALQRVAAGQARWLNERWRAARLVELGDKRAAPVLAQILKQADLEEYGVEEMLEDARKLDPSALRDIAPRYLNARDLGVRAQAAMALLGTAQADEARKKLGEILAGADYSNFGSDDFYQAIDALLKDGNADSRRVAMRAFEGSKLADFFDYEMTHKIIDAFAKAGVSDVYRYYLRRLDATATKPDAPNEGAALADKLVQLFDDSDTMKVIAGGTPPTSAQRVARVHAWLEDRIREVDAVKR